MSAAKPHARGGTWAGGRDRAKVQTGALLLCKGAKVKAELKGGSIGRPDDWLGAYIFGWQVAAPGGGWRGENIFGSRVSAIGSRVRVIRFGYGCGS